MPAADMPAAEVDVTEELVRTLLIEQCPDLADLELELLANGWDNAIFRLGDELTVRLPRRALSAELVAHEQRWLPELAPRLPLPIPAPIRCGRPSARYPGRGVCVGGCRAPPQRTRPPTIRRSRPKCSVRFCMRCTARRRPMHL